MRKEAILTQNFILSTVIHKITIMNSLVKLSKLSKLSQLSQLSQLSHTVIEECIGSSQDTFTHCHSSITTMCWEIEEMEDFSLPINPSKQLMFLSLNFIPVPLEL